MRTVAKDAGFGCGRNGNCDRDGGACLSRAGRSGPDFSGGSIGIAGTFGRNRVQAMAYLKVYARDLGRKHPAVWGIDPYTACARTCQVPGPRHPGASR
jgi:hypothetical protein